MKRKFHVSLEAARLMKEKGYDEKVEYMYDDNILTSIDVLTNSQIDRYYRNMYGVEFYGAPTKAEAIDWLESKGMLIEITIDIDECAWIFNIVDKEKFITIGHPKDGEFFTDRLEAEEAAIIKALELL